MLRGAKTTSIAEGMRRPPLGGDPFIRRQGGGEPTVFRFRAFNSRFPYWAERLGHWAPQGMLSTVGPSDHEQFRRFQSLLGLQFKQEQNML